MQFVINDCNPWDIVFAETDFGSTRPNLDLDIQVWIERATFLDLHILMLGVRRPIPTPRDQSLKVDSGQMIQELYLYT